MGLKDDVKAISDSKNEKIIKFNKRINDILGDVTKEIYKSSYVGKYSTTFSYKKADEKVNCEVMTLLRNEGFEVIWLHKSDETESKLGYYKISWKD